MPDPKRFLQAVLLACALAGCSSPNPKPAAAASEGPAFAAPSNLAGTLAEGGHIDLIWKNHATEPGGNWLEFTTPGSDFVKLAVFWPDLSVYRHPDVAPDAKYMYRVVPFFGHPSPIVSATTGPAPKEGTPDVDEEGPLPEPDKAASSSAPKKSIRDLATIAEAAPSEVTATLHSPGTIDLRWQDRAANEDGFVVEASADPAVNFQVCALLDPNTTSFRKTHLPPETKCYFRVRAFFYGKPSQEITVNTGPQRAQAQPAN